MEESFAVEAARGRPKGPESAGDCKKYPAAAPGVASAFLQSICLILQTSPPAGANPREAR
jgi:hypothetical protein